MPGSDGSTPRCHPEWQRGISLRSQIPSCVRDRLFTAARDDTWSRSAQHGTRAAPPFRSTNAELTPGATVKTRRSPFVEASGPKETVLSPAMAPIPQFDNPSDAGSGHLSRRSVCRLVSASAGRRHSSASPSSQASPLFHIMVSLSIVSYDMTYAVTSNSRQWPAAPPPCCAAEPLATGVESSHRASRTNGTGASGIHGVIIGV